MSGMFQRIARRHADRSDEPVPSETAGTPEADAPAAEPQPASPADQAAAAGALPADATQAGAAEVAPAPAPSEVDAPTERIEAVAPAPGLDQPTVFQPVVPAQDPPEKYRLSTPPPAVDLTTRIPAVPAPAAGPPAAPVPTAAPPAPVAAAAPTPAGEPAAGTEAVPRRPGFRARGRMRRRLRYLRRLRELQVRDLGGLVFDLRRFERKRDDLVAQKLDQIRACDDELHALERALDERRDLRDVREPGIGGTCPRCFAIFGSADRFCANCGAALGGAVQGPAQVPLAPPSPPQASGNGPQP